MTEVGARIAGLLRSVTRGLAESGDQSERKTGLSQGGPAIWQEPPATFPDPSGSREAGSPVAGRVCVRASSGSAGASLARGSSAYLSLWPRTAVSFQAAPADGALTSGPSWRRPGRLT